MATEVMKLISAALDVSFNSGHYTAMIKWQLLNINLISESLIIIVVIAVTAPDSISPHINW